MATFYFLWRKWRAGEMSFILFNFVHTNNSCWWAFGSVCMLHNRSHISQWAHSSFFSPPFFHFSPDISFFDEPLRFVWYYANLCYLETTVSTVQTITITGFLLLLCSVCFYYFTLFFLYTWNRKISAELMCKKWCMYRKDCLWDPNIRLRRHQVPWFSKL